MSKATITTKMLMIAVVVLSNCFCFISAAIGDDPSSVVDNHGSSSFSGGHQRRRISASGTEVGNEQECVDGQPRHELFYKTDIHLEVHGDDHPQCSGSELEAIGILLSEEWRIMVNVDPRLQVVFEFDTELCNLLPSEEAGQDGVSRQRQLMIQSQLNENRKLTFWYSIRNHYQGWSRTYEFNWAGAGTCRWCPPDVQRKTREVTSNGASPSSSSSPMTLRGSKAAPASKIASSSSSSSSRREQEIIRVTGFGLYEALTYPPRRIMAIDNSSVVNLNSLDTRLSIMAETSGNVMSMSFDFDTQPGVRMEQSPSLFSITDFIPQEGEDPSTYEYVMAPFDLLQRTGTHTVTAHPYSETNLGGYEGESLTVTFVIVDEETNSHDNSAIRSVTGQQVELSGRVPPADSSVPTMEDDPAVTGFGLYRSNTVPPQRIRSISNYDILDLSDVGRDITIVAETEGNVQSLNFDFDQEASQVVTAASDAVFSITGDTTPYDKLLRVGTHVLSAHPYAESKLSGRRGRKKTISFLVVDSSNLDEDSPDSDDALIDILEDDLSFHLSYVVNQYFFGTSGHCLERHLAAVRVDMTDIQNKPLTCGVDGSVYVSFQPTTDGGDSGVSGSKQTTSSDGEDSEAAWSQPRTDSDGGDSVAAGSLTITESNGGDSVAAGSQLAADADGGDSVAALPPVVEEEETPTTATATAAETTTVTTYEYEQASKELNWWDHYNAAKAKGCDLASISSAEDNAAVTATCQQNSNKEYCWIGAVRKGNGEHDKSDGSSAAWEWVDGITPFNYTSWRSDQPNGARRGETQLGVLTESRRNPGMWQDKAKTEKRKAVYQCTSRTSAISVAASGEETDASQGAGDVTPTNTDVTSTDTKTTRYHYVYEWEKMNWVDHNAAAKARGCELASITSPEENMAVTKVCQTGGNTQHCWTGAEHKSTVDTYASDGTSANWQWSDGRPFTYTSSWAAGQPNGNGKQDGVIIQASWYYEGANAGNWQDKSKRESHEAVYRCPVVGDQSTAPAIPTTTCDSSVNTHSSEYSCSVVAASCFYAEDFEDPNDSRDEWTGFSSTNWFDGKSGSSPGSTILGRLGTDRPVAKFSLNVGRVETMEKILLTFDFWMIDGWEGERAGYDSFIMVVGADTGDERIDFGNYDLKGNNFGRRSGYRNGIQWTVMPKTTNITSYTRRDPRTSKIWGESKAQIFSINMEIPNSKLRGGSYLDFRFPPILSAGHYDESFGLDNMLITLCPTY